MTPVMVCNDLYGDSFGVLRSINDGGCIIAMPFIPPIGTAVSVVFVRSLHSSSAAMAAKATVYEHETVGRLEQERLVIFKFTGEWS